MNYVGLSPYSFQTVEGEDGAPAKLQDLKFNGIDCTDQFSEAGFDSTWRIKNPWSDTNAQFFKSCLAPTKLESYFLKGTGPKSRQSPGKGNLFESMTAMCREEYDNKVKKKLAADQALEGPAMASGSSKDGDLAKKVKEIENKERAKKMEEIRKSSKESLEKKAKSKMVQIAKAKAKVG